jgi:hypothetical protein
MHFTFELANYELLSGHLEIFSQWLNEVNFKPFSIDGNPPDLAFMIAPSCPSLLKRKLEFENIRFIEANKIIIDPKVVTIEEIVPINLNKADKVSIVFVFKGTRIQGTTIDKLINFREDKTYENLDELASRIKLTPKAKQILEEKMNKNEICFS